jgi:hypothetical protein
MEPGSYYCTTYLTPNGLACTVDGAFQFYITVLQTMKTLAAENTYTTDWINGSSGWVNNVNLTGFT